MKTTPLVDGFDHAIFAVRDLAEGVRRFERLGFDVQEGGRHPRRGTHNAIVRFGVDYIELLSVCDRAEREAAGSDERPLLDYLDEREGGWYGWCASTRYLDQLVATVHASRRAASAFAMSRRRPDGRLLSWRLLRVTPRPPGWPGVIEWDQSDTERLGLEAPGRHGLGATGIAGLVLSADDDGEAFANLRDELHLGVDVDATRCRLAGCTVQAQAGEGYDRIERPLGVDEVAVGVADLAEATRQLERRGVCTDEIGDDRRLVAPDHLFGARLVLIGANHPSTADKEST